MSSQELGTMSKNNLRRISLAGGPISGIHSLTLIISCLNEKNLVAIPNQRTQTQNLAVMTISLTDIAAKGWSTTVD